MYKKHTIPEYCVSIFEYLWRIHILYIDIDIECNKNGQSQSQHPGA